MNATVVPPGPLGFLTLFPSGFTRPAVSTLNAVDGALTSNAARTHLILDINGYFAP